MNFSKTALVIAAHMDDEVLSNSMYILSRIRKGYRVIVYIPYGRRYKDKSEAQSFQEQYQCLLAAKKLLGYHLVDCMNYQEGEPMNVGYYTLLDDLETLIQGVDEVVIPSSNDTNQDHRFLNDVCGILTRPANRGRLKLILESLTYDSQLVEPTYYIPMSEADMELKLDAISCYTSEERAHPHVRSRNNVLHLHSIWGSKCFSYCAEAYIVRMVKE